MISCYFLFRPRFINQLKGSAQTSVCLYVRLGQAEDPSSRTHDQSTGGDSRTPPPRAPPTTACLRFAYLQVVQVDLNQPMDKIREFLGGYSIRTRLSLTGTIVVARDIAHAKLQERIDAGKGLPDYVKDHIIYYAGKGGSQSRLAPALAGKREP